jgi:hypothetical protein
LTTLRLLALEWPAFRDPGSDGRRPARTRLIAEVRHG